MPSSVLDPRLGRIPQLDERNKAFQVFSVISLEQQVPKTYSWDVKAHLDQGQEGACVGFAFSHELLSPPNFRAGQTNETAKGYYCEIQKVDPWPGGECDGNRDPLYSGTSVLSGVKYFVGLGYYSAYRWALSEEEMFIAVGNKGPAVIGVNWYSGMEDPDSSGFIHVDGQIMGGHCTLVYGVDVESGFYRIWNSWGESWGQDGTCKISRADMARLLQEDGECVLPESVPVSVLV